MSGDIVQGGRTQGSDLTEAEVDRLANLATEIAHFSTMANASRIFAGRALLEAREIFSSDQEFGSWRQEVLPGLHQKEALRYMHVAKEYGDRPKIIEALSFRTLRALAAPSTPQEVRDSVEAKAEGGESTTAAEVERMVRETRAANTRAEQAEAESERHKRRAEAALDGQQEAVEKAKTEASRAEREKLDGQIRELQDQLSQSKQKLETATKDAADAATRKIQAEAESLIQEKQDQVQSELDKALKRKVEAEKAVEGLVRRKDFLQEKVDDLSDFLASKEAATHEAEQVDSALKGITRTLTRELGVISTMEHDHGDVLTKTAANTARMCRDMAEAIEMKFQRDVQFDVIEGSKL